MSKKFLAARQQKNRALAEQDAANRCSQCKRNLSEVGVILQTLESDRRFCSESCVADYLGGFPVSGSTVC